MAKVHKCFRLQAALIEVIQQHQRRLNFPTDTDALEDILKQFNKSQQSRIKKLLSQNPQIERVLLSDFIDFKPQGEVQPQ
jgi:hypothetical protein